MGCSGVSSLSALSGDEGFSPPDEKSRSSLRGVVKAGFCGIVDEEAFSGRENKKGCEPGSRRAGVDGFSGESKAL